jgi:hypothetical protein
MHDVTAFERQVADEIFRIVGPIRPVDDAAIFTAVTAAQSPRWGLQAINSAMKFVVAGAIVAVFAGVLLSDAMITRRTDEQMPAVAPAASPSASSIPTHRYQSTGFPAAGPLEAGRHGIIRDSMSSDFAVPAGWTSDGVSVITRAADGASVRFWPTSPSGVHSDGCAGGPVRALTGPEIDPAAIMATIPGTVGPSEAVVAGRIAAQVALTVPDGSACGDEAFRLWSDEDPDGRSDAGPGDTIGMWIVPWGVRFYGVDPPLWIEARTPKGARPGIDAEIAQVVASMTAPEDAPLFPPAGPLEIRPRHPDQPGEFEFPTNYPHGWGTGYLDFSAPTSGWRSSGFDDVGNGGGSIMRGEPGTPDGAVITFSRPDHLYADPCAHTLLDPPPGPTVDDLVSALSAIPGTNLVSGPTDVTVQRQRGPVGPGGGTWVAKQLVLRVRDDIGCDPEQFYLWADECVTTRVAGDGHLGRVCLERPDPRPARARGSTITLLILGVVGGRESRILIDAETYAGATPEVEEEVRGIIDSVVIPFYGSG